jgi:hypothetical protein
MLGTSADWSVSAVSAVGGVRELFAPPVPAATLDPNSGQVKGLAVEEHLKRIREQLLPLLDRANKMLIRNLTAVRGLRRGPTPAVAIEQAEQVNVGEKQVNSIAR